MCDITYGTNNEFGFDYLRDNMVVRAEDRVQRPHNYRDRRRGRLGPDRRGANPAHHLRTGRRVEPAVRPAEAVRRQPGSGAERRRQRACSRRRRNCSAKDDGDSRYRAGIRLLQVQRGSPKNKRFLKLTAEGDLKKLIHQVETDYMRDKRLHELDEDLLFYIDERGHTISPSERGREVLAPPGEPDMFVLPDLSEGIGADRSRRESDADAAGGGEGEAVYGVRAQERGPRERAPSSCAPTRSSRRTSSTSFRTERS